MPTRFYFLEAVQSAQSPTTAPGLTSAPVTVAFSAGWTNTSGARRSGLGDPGRLYPRTVGSTASQAETINTAHNILLLQYVSAPMAAGQSISGTIKGQAICTESATFGDARSQIRAYVVSLDGQTERAVLRELDSAAMALEWATTATNRSFPQNTAGVGEAISAYVTQEGDRLVFELGARVHNVSTSSLTVSMASNGSAALAESETGSIGAGWVELSANITMLPEGAGGTISAATEGVASVVALPNVAASDQSFLIAAGGSPQDLVPPVISAFTPASGSGVEHGETISVTVTDDNEVSSVVVLAEFDSGPAEVVYTTTTGFLPPYDTASIANVATAEVTLAMGRDPGWRGSTIAFTVIATDAGGNETTSTASFTITDGGGPSISWTTPEGAIDYDDPIALNIDSALPITTALVYAVYGDGTTDLVYDAADGGSIYSDYQTHSSEVTTSASIELSLRHNYAWADAVSLFVFVQDASGNGGTYRHDYTLNAPSDPVLLSVSPADLSTILPTDPLTFDVLVPRGVRRVMVGVSFPSTEDAPEIAHDGSAFQTAYGASTRTEVIAGTRYRYVLRRSGGWYARPSPVIFTFDRSGREG